MELERAINVMGWKMLGHSVHIPHEEQEKAARLIRSKLLAAQGLVEVVRKIEALPNRFQIMEVIGPSLELQLFNQLSEFDTAGLVEAGYDKRS